MLPIPSYHSSRDTSSNYQLAQQQTAPLVPITPYPPDPASPTFPPTPPARRKYTRIVAITIAVVLAIALYFIWRTPPSSASSPSVTQQNFTTSSTTTNSPATTGGDIQVYIVGAIKHPGVYTLPAGARVYQLVQAAGGPLPKANLVALNMAAKLSDGQEVYVTVIGEIPPTYIGGVPAPGTGSGNTNPGQLININTATVAQMQQALHISTLTAQKIVDYRLAHGTYTSVDQLLQVVSKSIYNKIKSLVTV